MCLVVLCVDHVVYVDHWGSALAVSMPKSCIVEVMRRSGGHMRKQFKKTDSFDLEARGLRADFKSIDVLLEDN
jgi:hypothetical protein